MRNIEGLSPPYRLAVALAAVAAVVLGPSDAGANGAVLPPVNTADPSTLDVEVAVAVTPFGATRWTRLTVAGTDSMMWLVPVRPGAALDWASEGWLVALESATLPSISPPSETQPCGLPTGPERATSWSSIGTKKFPRAVTVNSTESATRALASSRGFAVSDDVAAKIADVYTKGYVLVSAEFDTTGGPISTPTLRINDDGGSMIPLALTGSTQTAARVTAIVIGQGAALLPGSRDLDPSTLVWGKSSSDYGTARANLLATGGGAFWLRESASHDVLFDGVAVPRSTPIQPLLGTYFLEATGSAQPTCEGAARNLVPAAGSLGRICAPGALAMVPGGNACARTSRRDRSHGLHVWGGRRMISRSRSPAARRRARS